MTLQNLMDSFVGNYTEDYCKNNGLFLAYDDKGILEHKTRQIVSYHEDIIETDLNFILGEYQELTSENKDVDKIESILNENKWRTKIQSLVILQGLILGATAWKVGRDEKGNIKIGIVSLLKNKIIPIYDSDEIVAWKLKYNIQEGEGDKIKDKKVIEYFGKDAYKKWIDDDLIMDIPNKYDIPWLFWVQNKQTIDNSIYGKGEWENYRNTVDEINSSYSRISRIEDIYADPHYLVSGSTNIDIKKEHKVWANPNENGDIKILEYQGNVMDSILSKIEHLEQSLRDKAPELMLNDLGNISGYALRLKMQKLEKKIHKLRSTYFSSFKDFFKLIYKMQTNHNQDIEIEYTSDLPIPVNEEELMKKLMTLHSLGGVSLQTLVNELGYNYKEEEKLIEKETTQEIGNITTGEEDA